LASGLKVDLKIGLTEENFDLRDETYGSNMKEPYKVTPFCRLFIGAMNDFMLKVLIVCAFISIVVEMIFSDHREIGKIDL
jgi:magnesium-transporting ATPase (P-type)